MYAEAVAISEFAEREGEVQIAEKFARRAEEIKEKINRYLWDGDFYKALHGDTDEEVDAAFSAQDFHGVPREEIGYIPWMFSIPPRERNTAFSYLADEKCFLCDFGYTTADRSDLCYLFEADHECLWNGYVWPFATSETLTALYTAARGDRTLVPIFIEGLKRYADSHKITLGEKVLPWIDEVISPLDGSWSSRTILENLGWQRELGGVERGKDYNHSTFIDLIISGTVGVKCDKDALSCEPMIPEDWDYFRLENLEYRGKVYTVTYDKTGRKYGRGKGLIITSEE